MTTKVKAKPLSEIRREEKLRKLQRKAKVAAKITASEAERKKLVAEAQKSRIDFEKVLSDLQERKVSENRRNAMTLEEYFVHEVESLDITLSQIVASIKDMSEVRTSLKWDLLKKYFSETEAEELENVIKDLEETNNVYVTKIEDTVKKACEKLEVLKLSPSREGVDEYALLSSTEAFAIFADWNEVVINKFFIVNDRIEALNGESK